MSAYSDAKVRFTGWCRFPGWFTAPRTENQHLLHLPITLDDAIARADEVARDEGKTAQGCAHWQLHEWLNELKGLRGTVAGVGVDRLASIWNDQVGFMRLLQARRGFPPFPVDLTSKPGQRLVKEIAQDAAGEIFEALAHLKNAKLHRAADVPALDRAAFVEELVDAFKLLIEVAVLSGVSLDEFWAAYAAKTEVNRKRIEGEY